MKEAVAEATYGEEPDQLPERRTSVWHGRAHLRHGCTLIVESAADFVHLLKCVLLPGNQGDLLGCHSKRFAPRRTEPHVTAGERTEWTAGAGLLIHWL